MQMRWMRSVAIMISQVSVPPRLASPSIRNSPAGAGCEYQSLSQLVGGKSPALELYRLFRDPHSSFDIASRQYSFMTIGPVSPLSFAGTPLFLNVFNSVEVFMRENHLTVAGQA